MQFDGSRKETFFLESIMLVTKRVLTNINIIYYKLFVIKMRRIISEKCLKNKRSKVVWFYYYFFIFSQTCEVEIPPRAVSAKDQYTYYQLVFQPSNCSLKTQKTTFLLSQMNNPKVLWIAPGHPEQTVEFPVTEGVGQFFSALWKTSLVART